MSHFGDFNLNEQSLARPVKRETLSDAWTIPLWKSLLDKFFAAFALVFFAPFFFAVAVLICIKQDGQVFYGHTRVGQNGRLFTCWKFRTMSPDAEKLLQDLLDSNPEARRQWQENRKLENDPRVTCFGRFLRKSSLDELPQFWNVLRGDMSIVGPRPITEGETSYYGNYLVQYSSVRPGITGLWQVSGRSQLGYEERVKKDVAYVKGQSLRGDVNIILKTVGVVLKGDGAC